MLRRIVGEFLEMPGLSLTAAQGARLWGIDEATSTRLLDALSNLGLLTRRDCGRYRRANDGPLPL